MLLVRKETAMEAFCYSVCFTGHRDIPEAREALVREALRRILRGLAAGGTRRFLAGGALGFDTMAAEAVLELREEFPVRLVLVLPCKNQTRGWSGEDAAIYQDILSRADEVIYTAETYFSGCMHLRNRRLVDESEGCIAYLTSERGGTAYTVRYAERQGVEVVNLAELL